MSKVHIYKAGKKDSFLVSSANVTTGWIPGQFASFDETDPNYVKLTPAGHEAIGMMIDDDDELSTFPTGSKVTVVYGAGGKYGITHAEEVAAGSAARAYESAVESATPNDLLYVSENAKLTTTASGSCVGVLQQVPTAANSYEVIFLMRI